MIFSLDIRKARKGDCLLLHYGDTADAGLILIDGGPSKVYRPHLRPRLEQIRKARGLDGPNPLLIDMLMVSHVDDDHIQGILELTKDMIDGTAPPVRIARMWHNSFDEIIGNDPDVLTSAMASSFGAASLQGTLPEDATVDADLPEEVIVWNLKVLASVAQGHQLRGDAGKLGIDLNPEYDGKLIEAHEQSIEFPGGLNLHVAGPMRQELEKLQKQHDEWLRDQKDKPGGSALAAYVDRSVPNLSSIVVLAEVDGKKILLTGDARGDRILQGLETTGALAEGGTMHVDVLKVPHHGSANNLETDFFRRITADHYVFSGDGEHGNPEREAFEMLWEARGNASFTVHLTYAVEDIDVEREKDWKKEQAKEIKKNKPPRSNWSAAKNSLQAFFKTKQTAKQKLQISDGNGAHVIDLLDPLGF